MERDIKKETEIGGIFENMFKSAFQEVSTQIPCLIRKITDSKMAGNIIKKVAGDFEIRIPGPVSGTCYNFIVECKASRVQTNFDSTFRGFMNSEVFGEVRKEKRAGSIPVVLFYSTLREEIEVWDYMKIVSHYPFKRSPLSGPPEMTVVTRNLKSLCKRWVLKPEEFAGMFRFKIADQLLRE